jgi:hypothetical protein
VKLQEALREIRSLQKKVQQLTKEIESIKATSLEDPLLVEKKLRMRGIKVFRKNPTEGLFFPSDLSPFHKTRFYEMMKKYSFRLVLRDMIKYQDRFRIQELTRYCSSRVVRGYCDLLCEMRAIVKNGGGKYRTRVSPLYSFGPTLEWFIAEMFKREFASPAIYGVSVKNTPSGGDYDVMASWNERLVYVEVKSSPPKGVEQNEISAFFSRRDDLLPDVTFLFNDTQLRMKDKLVVMFEEELGRRHGRESRTLYPVERLFEELFHVQNHIFIVNSKKDVVENFQICLKHYLRYGTPSPRLRVVPTSPLPNGERKKMRGTSSTGPRHEK